MPVNATGRKILSDLVKAMDDLSSKTAVQFNTATITVGGTGSIDNIGIPVIWVDGNSRFEVYVAQNIATAIATGNSPLKDGSVIAMVVGSALGTGLNKADTDISTDTEVTALFRGDAAIVDEGIDWGSANGTAQGLFLDQLELQRITTIDNAEVVSPTYTS